MGHTITILSIVLCTSVRAMERMDHEEQWQSDQQDCKLVSNRKSLMNEYHLPQCETAQEAERPSTPTEVHDLVMWDKMDDQYDGTLTDEETSGSSHQTQAKSKMDQETEHPREAEAAQWHQRFLRYVRAFNMENPIMDDRVVLRYCALIEKK